MVEGDTLGRLKSTYLSQVLTHIVLRGSAIATIYLNAIAHPNRKGG